MKKNKTSIYQPPKHIPKGASIMLNDISHDINIQKANHLQFKAQVHLAHKTKK